MKKKRLDLPSYTYFISCADTSVSESIIELVRNDFTGDSPPHTILGNNFFIINCKTFILYF